jgi:hypothetical protein
MEQEYSQENKPQTEAELQKVAFGELVSGLTALAASDGIVENFGWCAAHLREPKVRSRIGGMIEYGRLLQEFGLELVSDAIAKTSGVNVDMIVSDKDKKEKSVPAQLVGLLEAEELQGNGVRFNGIVVIDTKDGESFASAIVSPEGEVRFNSLLRID